MDDHTDITTTWQLDGYDSQFFATKNALIITFHYIGCWMEYPYNWGPDFIPNKSPKELGTSKVFSESAALPPSDSSRRFMS